MSFVYEDNTFRYLFKFMHIILHYVTNAEYLLFSGSSAWLVGTEANSPSP